MTRAREVAVALVVAAGIGTGLAAQGSAASRGELDALAQEVDRVESLRRIKDLDRTFAQLAQFGEFKKMASLFAADGTLQWGTEVATGGNAIQNWLTTDAGAMNGIAAGSLNFMIIDNPSISLSADGSTAKGRWNGLRFMGDGKGATRIAGGIYENEYVLENGSWKFAKLRYWRQFDGDYEKGWRNADNALLPVVPYHFTPDSVGVPIPAPSVQAPRTSQRAEDLFGRIQALNDEDDVRNLQHSYGAYVDRRMWSDVVDLFAADGTLLIAGVGTFNGSAGIRQALAQTMGPEGLAQFILNEHPLWDTIVEVQPGGKTATARGMEYAMIGNAKREASWSFSVFRNTFVKEDGLWKIKDMSITPLITANWADGWGKGGIGPQVHYDPPAFLDTSRRTRPANAPANLADLTRRLARSHAWDGSENVNNSYGFFFDDLDCGQLGQIYARQGFKESPFQGFFRTPDRIAEACRVAWGRNQPEMRPSLSYHWQPQPVILVSHDGRSTRSRSRLFQPGTSRNFARGFSGAIYNSQFVLENGVWKFWDTTIDEHYYTSSLARSWSAAVPRDPSSPTPPPSANIAKYAPDLLLTEMNEREIGFRGGVNPLIVWPDIIPMWFNHRNLVTGRVPQYYQPDCTPCGVKPSWSMLQFGYQLPPNGPHIDGVEAFPKVSPAPAATLSGADQPPFVKTSRVTVWDVAPGAPAPATSPSHDVVTFVIRGDASNAQGTAVYRAKGASPQPVPADARTVVIELQDVTVPPLANKSGQPLAFPRPGIKKLLETDRVVVWSYTWTLGMEIPMHFHDKDAVAVFLADGVLSGTDEKGETGTSEHHFGLIRVNTRGRQHTEILASGQASAVILELK